MILVLFLAVLFQDSELISALVDAEDNRLSDIQAIVHHHPDPL